MSCLLCFEGPGSRRIFAFFISFACPRGEIRVHGDIGLMLL